MSMYVCVCTNTLNEDDEGVGKAAAQRNNHSHTPHATPTVKKHIE